MQDLHLTIADDSGVILTLSRTDRTASFFDDCVRRILTMPGGFATDFHECPSTSELYAVVAEECAASFQISGRELGMAMGCGAFPWIPKILLSGYPRKRLAWIILHHQPAGYLRHIWS